MAHAHHFLERLDRVTRAHAEFALGLYRDHEAVRYVLDRANLADDVDRVALAIDDPKEGPFIIVTRDGRFVTCLARGMHQDRPVITRPRIDALLAKVADKRARKELAARERRPDEDEDDVFLRVVKLGYRFSREDFLAVSIFEALLGQESYRLTLEFALEVTKTRALMAPGAPRVAIIKEQIAKALEKLDRLEWAVAHLTVLMAAGERPALDALVEHCKAVKHGTPTFAAAMQCNPYFFLRGAWAAARLGREAIPLYRDTLATGGDWMQLLDAALGLGAIGLRHASCFAEVRRILDAYEQPKEGEQSVDATRAIIARMVLQSMDEAEDRTKTVMELGRNFCVESGKNLPEGSKMRFDKPEDVPDDIVRAAVLTFDGDAHDQSIQNFVLVVLPVAARASAEEFYLPREAVRQWYGRYEPQETLDRVLRWSKAEPNKQPARAEKAPGRNDPCTCGSGKKWKKCHGAPGAGPVPAKVT
ncbi:MAG TPA: SEC-C metal-binding domain-containing protein [Polyangiaceae bacterium]